MVADQVTVVSRKAGETQGWKWVSDGKGEFEIGETERAGRGTDIVLHIKKDAAEFLEKIRVSTIITKYSDHIALPIKLIEGGKEEKVNQAAACGPAPSRRSPRSSTAISTATSRTRSTSRGPRCISRPRARSNIPAWSSSPRRSRSTCSIPTASSR